MGHAAKQPITVLITEECNLRCEYCLTNSSQLQYSPRTIAVDFVKRGIADYYETNPAGGLRIYSVGEATTQIDVVKEIVAYARSAAGEKIPVELQSNGYFSPETAVWIAENIDNAWISLDGPPDIHDVYRKTAEGAGSSEVIIRNIQYLADKITIGIRSTTTDINVKRQKELLDFARSLGVMHVATKPVLQPVGCAKDRWTIDLMEYAHHFWEAWAYARKISMYYTCVLIFNFDCRTQYACRACLPVPHLTPDGYVTACDRAFSGATPLRELIYGTWLHDKKIIQYNKRNMESIRRRRPQFMKKCRSCVARDYCAGNCMGTGYQETGDLLGVSDRYCEAILFLYEKLRPYEELCTYRGGHP